MILNDLIVETTSRRQRRKIWLFDEEDEEEESLRTLSKLSLLGKYDHEWVCKSCFINLLRNLPKSAPNTLILSKNAGAAFRHTNPRAESALISKAGAHRRR